MKMGNAVEWIVADYLYDMQEKGEIETIDEQYPVKIEEPGLEYPISMKLDFVINRRYVLEIKSSYGRGIVEIQRKQEPKPEHLMQCWLYLHYSIFNELYLVYFGRDNGYRTEFWLQETTDGVIAYDRGFPIESPIEKFKYIEHAVRNKEIPDRDYLVAIKNGEIRDKFQKDNKMYKSAWQCNYCSWRDTCWAPVVQGIEGDNAGMFT
jgi:CRISPR/Cas system-associated exonuclease Cas4 (RecB family)